MADEWAKRRELELSVPGAMLTAKWKGVTFWKDAGSLHSYEADWRMSATFVGRQLLCVKAEQIFSHSCALTARQ